MLSRRTLTVPYFPLLSPAFPRFLLFDLVLTSLKNIALPVHLLRQVWVLVLGMLSKRALGGFWEGLGLDLGSILEGLGRILGRFG